MLYLNLKRVLFLRGVEKPGKFIENLGFAPATARKFLGRSVRSIALEHLERICLALNCTPNDLLEWLPPENRRADASAPPALAKLQRAAATDLQQMLGALPMEQVEQIADILQRELKNK